MNCKRFIVRDFTYDENAIAQARREVTELTAVQKEQQVIISFYETPLIMNSKRMKLDGTASLSENKLWRNLCWMDASQSASTIR